MGNYNNKWDNLTNIAEAYWKLNNLNESFNYIKKGFEIYKSINLTHYLVGSNLKLTGNLYGSLKSYEKAISYYNQALDICIKTIGENHRKTAALYSDIGNAYYNLKDYANAKKNYDKAYNIFIKNVGKNHPASKETEKHLADLYKTTGQNERAINIYQNTAANQRNISVDKTLNAREQVIITQEQALSFSDIASSSSRKTGIFVTEFETQGVDNSIKILIANRITQNIHALKKYAVLERRSLEKVLQQIQLSQSDLFDSKKAPLIGKLVPAKGVICGNIIKYGNEIAIEARLIKVKSGEIIRNAFVSIKTNDISTITDACKILTKELMNI